MHIRPNERANERAINKYYICCTTAVCDLYGPFRLFFFLMCNKLSSCTLETTRFSIYHCCADEWRSLHVVYWIILLVCCCGFLNCWVEKRFDLIKEFSMVWMITMVQISSAKQNTCTQTRALLLRRMRRTQPSERELSAQTSASQVSCIAIWHHELWITHTHICSFFCLFVYLIGVLYQQENAIKGACMCRASHTQINGTPHVDICTFSCTIYVHMNRERFYTIDFKVFAVHSYIVWQYSFSKSNAMNVDFK